MKRKILTFTAMLFAVLGLTLGAPNPASALDQGSVSCVYGNNHMDGIWVNVPGGTSGWATHWDNGYGGEYYTYFEIDNGKTHDLHIGCGGTSQDWGTTFYVYNISEYFDLVCSGTHGCVSS